MTSRDMPTRLLTRQDALSASTRLLMVREARLAASSTILIGACLLACWSMWGSWIGGGTPDQSYSSDLYTALFYNAAPLLFGAFLLGAWTIARERPKTTQELFTAAPLSAWHRTAARLAVAAVPALAAALIVSVQAALVSRAGGVPLGDVPFQVHVMPSLVEWASIPVATVASFTGGAAVYTFTRSRAVTTLVGGFATFFGVMAYWLVAFPPAGFISPIGNPVPERDLTSAQLGEQMFQSPLASPDTPGQPWQLLDPDPVFSAAHSAALLGMAMLFAALTLERTVPARRNHRLAWFGAGIVAVASLAQVATYLLS